MVLCVCTTLSIALFLQKAHSQPALSGNISFAAESNSMYFLDRDEAKVYKYNIQGKLVRIYTVKELGKDLLLK
jgi:hypothetical protein